MSVWFTSDLHLGHLKVAEDRAMREAITAPWADVVPGELQRFVVAWHDRALAFEWDSVVGPKDQVWILGDISSGSSLAQHRALDWLAQRPGFKHLIPGNHDGCHPMHRDAHKWQQIYQPSPFLSVQAFARRRIAGKNVLLSHFPYVGDHTEEDRATQYRLRDEGEWLLHGHTHAEHAQDGRHPHQINVGVDAWDMRPVHLDSLAHLIEAHLIEAGAK